ncbi:MAG TPA: LD-carboxypeptidase [Burkholderiaceae bacterium]|nr:LD-carboxypeptidase [Burkholderiaceae bacterium]
MSQVRQSRPSAGVPAAEQVVQPSIYLFSPAGAVQERKRITAAAKLLRKAGCAVEIDSTAGARLMRFAGSDEERVAAFTRAAGSGADAALATRGGYGMHRLMHRLDFRKLARSKVQWVGMSDFTAFSLGMLSQGGGAVTWSGPLATDQLAAEQPDEVTLDAFLEAMRGELEAVGFVNARASARSLDIKGTLWGGNLCVLTALLGTRFFPDIKGGILFLEDVGEHPYRIERMLLQLLHAGVLARQKAVVLGHFTQYKPVPNDRGFKLKTVIDYVQSQIKAPILTGLPAGHVPTVLTLPIGRATRLLAEGRDAFLVWEHHH